MNSDLCCMDKFQRLEMAGTGEESQSSMNERFVLIKDQYHCSDTAITVGWVLLSVTAGTLFHPP